MVKILNVMGSDRGNDQHLMVVDRYNIIHSFGLDHILKRKNLPAGGWPIPWVGARSCTFGGGCGRAKCGQARGVRRCVS